MNCDPIARWYRWLEYAGMGRSLERRREEYLDEVATARRVLILGEGDGRFLRAFLEVNAAAVVDCVDASGRMLAIAEARVDGKSRVEFHHADARAWMPPTGARYDLVVSHFFLDCFTGDELAEMIPRFAGYATPDARWIVSEFRQPSNGWRGWRARVWIGGLYGLFGWATGLRVRRLPEYRSHLARAGFRLARETVANAGMLVSELWARGIF